jgi:hypothetical protein
MTLPTASAKIVTIDTTTGSGVSIDAYGAKSPFANSGDFSDATGAKGYFLSDFFTLSPDTTQIVLRDRITGNGYLVHRAAPGSPWLAQADNNTVVTPNISYQDFLLNWGFVPGPAGSVDVIGLQPVNASGMNIKTVTATVISAPSNIVYGADSHGPLAAYASGFATDGLTFAVVNLSPNYGTLVTEADIESLKSKNVQIVSLWEDTAVRVCPKTSGGITKFSEHEAD